MISKHVKPEHLAIFILLFGFVFIFGCVGSVGPSMYTDDYSGSLCYTAMYDNTPSVCGPSSCRCMVCQNGTGLFGPLTNLIGGRCYFEYECTPEVVNTLSRNELTPDLSIRSFMIGQGPTFSDFSSANPYCSHRLSMAVQWLVGDEDTPYELPDASRAMCLLSKDIIPVYILYSEGENINASRAGQIGNILGSEGQDLFSGRLTNGPVGPVIVVTEIDFEIEQAPLIAEQVRGIDRTCNDRSNGNVYCMIAVAPKMGDEAALDAVLQELGDDSNKVDFVAFGVNGRYTNSCDGSRILLDVTHFAEYSLYTHDKPTLIPYIMFDSSGTILDDDGNQVCEWTESLMQSAYSSFFPTGILTLQQRGVVGIAPYSFNSTTYHVSNPLHCSDCGVGKTAQRLQSWYSWCQSYVNITRLSPTGSSSHPSGSNLLVFPDAPGGYCDESGQFDYLLREISFGETTSSRDILNPQTPAVRGPTDTYFSCSACFVSNVNLVPPFSGEGARYPMPRTTTEDDPDVDDVALPGLTTRPDLDTVCHAYPEIKAWSDARNIDEMYVRAIILGESGFDPCSASRPCRAEHSDGMCFQERNPISENDEGYGRSFNAMYDPAGVCSFVNSGSTPADWQWTALGLLQILEPPYTFWPDNPNANPDHVQVYTDMLLQDSHIKPVMDLARQCNPDTFNPFDVNDNLCVGTAKIEMAYNAARGWVEANAGKLSVTDDYDKQTFLTGYVALYKLAGLWDGNTRRDGHVCANAFSNGNCWAYLFDEQKDVNADFCAVDDDGNYRTDFCSAPNTPLRNPPYECYGYTDFVLYVRECQVPQLTRQAYTGDRMWTYYYLLQNCDNSMCPDGRAFMNGICDTDNPDECNSRWCIMNEVTGHCQPRVPESGSYYIRNEEASSATTIEPSGEVGLPP